MSGTEKCRYSFMVSPMPVIVSINPPIFSLMPSISPLTKSAIHCFALSGRDLNQSTTAWNPSFILSSMGPNTSAPKFMNASTIPEIKVTTNSTNEKNICLISSQTFSQFPAKTSCRKTLTASRVSIRGWMLLHMASHISAKKRIMVSPQRSQNAFRPLNILVPIVFRDSHTAKSFSLIVSHAPVIASRAASASIPAALKISPITESFPCRKLIKSSMMAASMTTTATIAIIFR